MKDKSTFENGGNGQTITFDDRYVDDNNYNLLMKKKDEAIRNNDEKALAALKLDDFNMEGMRLSAEEPSKEILFTSPENQN